MSNGSDHRLNVEYRGELEDISRPSSNRTRTGARAGLPSGAGNVNGSASTISSRFKSGTSLATSLELLTPAEVLERDFDLELEDLASESEYTDDDDDDQTETGSNMNTGRTSDMFNIAEPMMDKAQRSRGGGASRPDTQEGDEFEDEDYLAARQLALFEDETEEEIEVGSDEERDIIKNIKDEITKQVKDELSGELAVYKEARERLEAGTPKKDADLDGLDPKLREAILRMRKLDKILEKKIRREKEVKRERILLQRRLRQELEEMGKEKKSITVEEKKNMDKYLALTLPPSHNAEAESCMALVPMSESSALEYTPVEGKTFESMPKSVPEYMPNEEGVNVDEASPPVTPVFQTQVPDERSYSARQARQATDGDSTAAPSRNAGSETPGAASEAGTTASTGTTDTTSTSGTGASSRHRKGRKKNKDFIKRNMELAADAGNAIAMTDDEKKRLEDLLGDLDALPEIPEEGATARSDPSTVNPYQVALSSGEGFHPSADETKQLEAIDGRLKALLPPEDFESICSTPVSQARSDQGGSALFVRSKLPSAASGTLDIDVDQLGEQALRDTKEHRELQQRLQDIEQELSTMTHAVEMEIESPTLTEGQLEELLNQCARTMSRATAETSSLAQSTSRSGMSTARSSLYENPPRLPDDVLQELLADARRSIMGSATPTEGGASVRDNDDLVLESVNEDTIKSLLQNSRTTSRMASRASLHSSHGISSQLEPHPPPSRAFLDNGDATDRSFTPESESRRPFLPKIDPKGTMSTQKLSNTGLNNEETTYTTRPSSSSMRGSAITIHNSFAGASVTTSGSFDLGSELGDTVTPTPHPPSQSRKSSAGRNGRTKTLADRDCID